MSNVRLEDDCEKIDAIDFAIHLLNFHTYLYKQSLGRALKRAKVKSFADSNGTVWRIDKDGIIRRTSLLKVQKQDLARRRKL